MIHVLVKLCLLYMQSIDAVKVKSVYKTSIVSDVSNAHHHHHQLITHASLSRDAEIHQAEPCNGYQDSLPSNPDQPCPT
jgi:hypothetical protein